MDLKSKLLSSGEALKMPSAHLTDQSGGYFVIHDGPPFANNSLHMGHILNKVIKDTIKRSIELFDNKKVDFRLGWDCHGLPIEKRSMEIYGEDNLIEGAYSIVEQYINEHLQDLQSLGVIHNGPSYQTIDTGYIKNVYSIFWKLMDKGLIYESNSPVYWSHEEGTSMSFSEVIEDQMTIKGTFVKLRLIGENAYLLVWTTMPWTIAGNSGVLYNPSFEYRILCKDSGDKLVVSTSSTIYPELISLGYVEIGEFNGFDLEYVLDGVDDIRRKIYPSDIVKMAGTGLVHISPSNGFVDYKLHKELSIPCLGSPVPYDGVDKMNDDAIKEFSSLLLDLNGKKYRTSVTKRALSWRSKKPLSVTTVPGVSMNISETLEKVIQKSYDVTWYKNGVTDPGEAFRSFLIERKKIGIDWNLTRQRSWGLPIPFVKDQNVREGILSYIENNDIHLIGESEFGKYIIGTFDVWFESGCSFSIFKNHEFDICVEGIDQHRGWFQSMAIISVALNDKIPYKSVVAHGYVMQDKNRKLSKSLGAARFVNLGIDGDVARSLLLQSDPYKSVMVNQPSISLAESRKKRMAILLGNLYSVIVNTPSNLQNNDVGKVSGFDSLNRWITYEVCQSFNEIKSHMLNMKFQMSIKLISDVLKTVSSYMEFTKKTVFVERFRYLFPKKTYQLIYEVLGTVCYVVYPGLYESLLDVGFEAIRSISCPEECKEDHQNVEFVLKEIMPSLNKQIDSIRKGGLTSSDKVLNVEADQSKLAIINCLLPSGFSAICV